MSKKFECGAKVPYPFCSSSVNLPARFYLQVVTVYDELLWLKLSLHLNWLAHFEYISFLGKVLEEKLLNYLNYYVAFVNFQFLCLFQLSEYMNFFNKQI